MTLPLTLWGYRPGACGAFVPTLGAVPRRALDIDRGTRHGVNYTGRTGRGSRGPRANSLPDRIRRVKCGEAWAVKVCGRGSSGLWAGRSTLNMTAFRHERALLDLEIARGVLEYWRRLVYAPRIVRVTFYEVRRG